MVSEFSHAIINVVSQLTVIFYLSASAIQTIESGNETETKQRIHS